MKMSHHVESLREALLGAARMGDEHAQGVAEKLADAVAPALQLEALAVAAELADDINRLTTAIHVDVIMTAEGPDLRVTALEPAPMGGIEPDPPSSIETEEAVRMTLRIPESVKAQADSMAQRAGKSLNSWIVAAIRRAVAQDSGIPFPPHGNPTSRGGFSGTLRGWVS